VGLKDGLNGSKKNTFTGIRFLDLRPVASRYIDHAIPAHKEFFGGLRNYSIMKTPVLHVAI